MLKDENRLPKEIIEVTIPESIQKTSGHDTWISYVIFFSWHSGIQSKAGPDDLTGLFKP